MNNVKTVVFLYLLESCMFDKDDNIPKYKAKHTLTNELHLMNEAL